MSAKLLVELAEGDVDVEDGMTTGPLRSLALRLAAAPPYKDPAEPPAAKPGAPSPPLSS
jgi:hypothetical protein